MKNKSAVALGRLARGKPKRYSRQELKRRTERLLAAHKLFLQQQKQTERKKNTQ